MSILAEIPIAIGSAIALVKALEIGIVLKKETTFRTGKIERPNRENDTPLSYDAIKGTKAEPVLRECIGRLEDVLEGKNKTYFHKNINNLKIGGNYGD